MFPERVIFKFSLGSRGCSCWVSTPLSVMPSCVHSHTQSYLSGPSLFLPSASIRIMVQEECTKQKIYPIPILPTSQGPHLGEKLSLWKWTNEWTRLRNGKYTRLCKHHNSWSVWPQANCLTSLCLCFLICKMWIIIVATSRGCENWVHAYMKSTCKRGRDIADEWTKGGTQIIF